MLCMAFIYIYMHECKLCYTSESVRKNDYDDDDGRQIRWLSLNANISFRRPKCTQIVETNIVIIYSEILLDVLYKHKHKHIPLDVGYTHSRSHCSVVAVVTGAVAAAITTTIASGIALELGPWLRMYIKLTSIQYCTAMQTTLSMRFHFSWLDSIRLDSICYLLLAVHDLMVHRFKRKAKKNVVGWGEKKNRASDGEGEGVRESKCKSETKRKRVQIWDYEPAMNKIINEISFSLRAVAPPQPSYFQIKIFRTDWGTFCSHCAVQCATPCSHHQRESVRNPLLHTKCIHIPWCLAK